MSNLNSEINTLKQKYREAFLKVGKKVNQELEKTDEEEIPALLNRMLKDSWERWVELLGNRENYNCVGCASCCKLAASEFSPKELAQKAQNKDNFAKQFLSVFIPYENEEEARKIYPEYFELLKEREPSEKVYFYHCPKVTKNNRCPDYENRPQICKDFPDNPLGLLPSGCGFKKWKEKVQNDALEIQALIEITSFFKEHLKTENL